MLKTKLYISLLLLRPMWVSSCKRMRKPSSGATQWIASHANIRNSLRIGCQAKFGLVGLDPTSAFASFFHHHHNHHHILFNIALHYTHFQNKHVYAYLIVRERYTFFKGLNDNDDNDQACFSIEYTHPCRYMMMLMFMLSLISYLESQHTQHRDSL